MGDPKLPPAQVCRKKAVQSLPDLLLFKWEGGIMNNGKLSEVGKGGSTIPTF